MSVYRNRQCTRCSAWLKASWVDGVLVGVDRPTAPVEAARSRLTSPNRYVYRLDGVFFYFVSDRMLADLILTRPDTQVYVEHEHQPLDVRTPEPGDDYAPEFVPGPQDAPPF